MNAIMQHSKARRGLALYFTFIGLVTLLYAAFVLTHVAREWLLAEWLINYEGGFVRRGLPGEVALLSAHALHLSPVTLVVALCILLYGLLLACLFSLASRASRRYWVWAMLLSPATLSFQVLDVLAGFHKELIYLVALAGFVLLLRAHKLSSTGTVVFLTVSLALMTLSHEALICFAPFFFAALSLAGNTFWQACRLCALPFLLAAVLAFICARHLGDASTALRICSSLGYPLVPNLSTNQICAGGAIAYLRTTPADALSQVAVKIRVFHYIPVYLGLAVLSIAPAVAGTVSLVRRGVKRQMVVLWACAAVAFAGSLLLFLYGADWGRWIYIHIMSLSILLLFVDGQAPGEREAERTTTALRQRVAWTLLALYSTVWTLPHFNENSPHFGYFSLADYFVSLPARMRHKHEEASAARR